MTLIDQRILIPAPMPAVWQVLADHMQLPRWRLDVQSVSLLTTERDRPGTRRRVTTKQGRHDVIEEIRIWYEGVGYEYQLVQGGDYRAYVSRLRLQGTADGTIVQWTISYDLGGILKRILRGRRRKKALETYTANSLRKLRQYIESTGVRVDQDYRNRTRIQQAPDANLRAEYGAKLVAQQQARVDAQKTGDTGRFQVPEPPVRLEDTPSVPKVMPPSFLSEAVQTAETAIPEPEPTPHDTRPGATPVTEPDETPGKRALTDADRMSPVRVAPGAGEPPATLSDTRPRSALTPDPPDSSEKTPETGPTVSDATEFKKETDAVSASDATLSSGVEAAGDAAAAKKSEYVPPPTSIRDTGEVSIWEVFGMRSPTEELSLSGLAENAATGDETNPGMSTTVADSLSGDSASVDDSSGDEEQPQPSASPEVAELPGSDAAPKGKKTNVDETLERSDVPELAQLPSEDDTQPKLIGPVPEPPAGPTTMDNDPTQPKESITADADVPLSTKTETAEHEAVVVESDAATASPSVADDPAPSTESTPDEQPSAQKPKNLDEWLAEDEPPLPESSTDTMKSVVRIYRKPKIGLRRIQKQRQMPVRRPQQDKDKPQE